MKEKYLLIFLSFEAGIAHAIANFKWKKNTSSFSFHLKLALLTQLPTSNERKIPPHLKIKPAKFHNGGFTQDLYMHICSISVKL